MKTSIVLATYNGEKFIEKQLDSLLNQTQLMDEIIIFDDCSTDGTRDIILKFIEKFKHNNIQCLFETNIENQGYKKNFYSALTKATGDIIFLCDQDDIWKTNKVKTICNLFKLNNNISSVSTSYEFIDGYDNKVCIPNFFGIQHRDLRNKNIKSKECIQISEFEIIIANISPGCTSAITSRVKDYYLQNASLLIPHDWEINIYSAKIGNLYFYNEPLVLYRIHSNNTIGLTYYPEKFKKFFYTYNILENKHEMMHNMADFYSFYTPRSKDKKITGYMNDFIAYSKKR